MTLEQYWTILIKRWKLVVICFLLVGGGTFIGSKLMKPLYQSSALVQVVIRSSSGNQADYNNLMASDQLVQTVATLATSDPVLREVASHYTGLTASQLAGEISSSPKTNTQLFEIDATDPSPTRAASLANDIATTLIKQQQQMIQQNNAQALQQIQKDIDLTGQQIDDTTTKISALQAKGGNQSQIALLQVQLSGLQQHYIQWQTALAQLELTQAQSGNPLQVVQLAQPTTSPVKPNVLLSTGEGLLLGLLLGMFLAVLLQQFDTRVRTIEALSSLLNWPVLATLYITKPSSKENVINLDGQNINTESYRLLRTNIGFAGIDKPLHSLMITSAQQGDGKSVIAANLAIFMARVGKHTLLIDADLRHPSQHALFNLPAERMGLSNALLAFSSPSKNIPKTPANSQFLQPLDSVVMSDLSLESFVHAVGFPNLWVMPSGPLPPNPPELLDSQGMLRFLTAVANCGVEIVIFDVPPILGLSDASILASKVDGALAVIDMTRASSRKLEQLKSALAQTGVKVLGCVANKYPGRRNDSAPYYYQAEERNDSEKQTRNEQVSSMPGTLSPMSSLPFEKERKFN